jgi:PmbA protein
MSAAPESSFVERLAAHLARRPSADGAEVVGWRFDLSESEALRAGLKDSRFGGPYDPPAVAAGIGGGIVLVWSDGLQTYGNVDSQALEAFSERVESWRQSAFADPYAPPLLPPTEYPAAETHDPRVDEIVAGDSAELFRLLRRSLEACQATGAKIVDAGVGAGRGSRHVYSSTGIRLSYRETSLSFWLSADDLYSRGYSKRRVIHDDEASDMIRDVAQTTAALREEGSAESGELPVVLPPDEAGSFLGQYVGSNLSGAAVVNDQAAYTLDDFRASKQIARSDVSMWVDTLIPLEGAASPASSEGVPGGRADLVRNGRLVSPVLDLKYSGRAAMPPTPMPRGGPGFLVASTRAEPAAHDLIQGVERGLYVYSVLGMHTQDSTSGLYSLVASQARAIVDGRLRDGKVKAVLAGNFFENLMDDRTLFAPFPYEWVPGMRVNCSVSVEG